MVQGSGRKHALVDTMARVTHRFASRGSRYPNAKLGYGTVQKVGRQYIGGATMLLKIRLACSFCGKRASEVSKLVAGPKVYICDVCVATASRIMSDTGCTTSQALSPSDAMATVYQ